MTSSFGTVVGTPRDQLPDISKTNYLQTDADMTEAATNAIDDSIKDAQAFYDDMVRIRELQQRNFDNNLQGLVNLTSSAAKFVETRQAGEEARELNRLSQDKIDEIRKKYTDAEGNFNIQNARFSNQLQNEAFDDKEKGKLDSEAHNLLKNIKGERPEDLTQRQINNDMMEKGFAARKKLLTENNFFLLNDAEEALELHNAADEVLLSKLILQAKAYGMSDEEFNKFYIKKIAPEMRRRRELNMQRWETISDRRFEDNKNKEVDNRIVDVIQSRKQPGETGEVVVPNIDGTDGLIEYIQLEKNFDTKLEAQNYLFSRVAQLIGDSDRLDATDGEFLLNEAKFTHNGTKQTTTYSESNFSSTAANSNLITNAINRFNGDPEKDLKAALNKFDDEMDEVFDKYDGSPPPEVVFDLMGRYRDDPILKFEKFPQKLLTAMSREQTGANFGDHPEAGKEQTLIYEARGNFKKVMEVIVGAETGDKTGTIPPEKQSEIEAALGDLRFRMNTLKAQKPSLSDREARDAVIGTVRENLQKGVYKDFYASKIDTLAKDIDNDRNALKNDKSLADNVNFNSVHEKEALRQMKRYLVSGGPMPTYFNDVIKGLKIRQEDGSLMNGIEYAQARLKATGGLDEKTGLINYKKDYNLDAADYDKLNDNPNQTKTYNFIESNKENATAILNGFAKERQRQSILKRHRTELSDEENDNFFKKPTDRITGVIMSNNLTDYNIESVYKMAKQGYTDFGRYGFTADEIIAVVDSGALDGLGSERFTEDYQTYVMLAVIRNRANRSSSMGGAQTEEKDWRRLTNLSPKEQDAVLAIFPKLRTMPMSQFQNLQADVAGLILTEAEKGRIQRDERRAAKEAERKKRQEEKAKANEGINRLRQKKKND